jgi:hypothetical protein
MHRNQAWQRQIAENGGLKSMLNLLDRPRKMIMGLIPFLFEEPMAIAPKARRRCYWAFLMLLIICPSANAQDPSQQADAVDEPRVYVREELVTTLGVRGGVQQEFNTRRDINICHVSLHNGVFVSDEQGTVENGVHDDDGRWSPRGGDRILRATHEFNVREGVVNPWPKPGKIGFNAELPWVAFEYFYFPMLPENEGMPPLGVERVATLSTGESFKPKFDGAWIYKCSGTDRRMRIGGPYLLESENKHYLIAGRLDHDVSLHPLRVIKLSGSAVCRVRPATAWYDSPVTPDTLDGVRQFEEMLSGFTFRMLPLDSVEAKTIEIPSILVPFTRGRAER